MAETVKIPGISGLPPRALSLEQVLTSGSLQSTWEKLRSTRRRHLAAKHLQSISQRLDALCPREKSIAYHYFAGQSHLRSWMLVIDICLLDNLGHRRTRLWHFWTFGQLFEWRFNVWAMVAIWASQQIIYVDWTWLGDFVVMKMLTMLNIVISCIL